MALSYEKRHLVFAAGGHGHPGGGPLPPSDDVLLLLSDPGTETDTFLLLSDPGTETDNLLLLSDS